MNTQYRRRVLPVFGALAILLQAACADQLLGQYELDFSTYLGGSQFEHIRDICADSDGNVYVTGGTTSPDFPTTEGALQTTFQAESGQSFVAKINWVRLLCDDA